ncbi:MAG: hypothetical protein ABIQ18_31585 [Umezawaea sp.]
MGYANEPGVLRRFWWHGTQKRRLVVVSASALVSLAGTGLVVTGGGHASPAPAVAARFPVITTSKPATTSTSVGPADQADQVDRVVAVRTVFAVDQFDGIDTASGDPIRARVVDIRSAAPCWQAESLDFARDALVGKEVRLVMSARGRTPDSRLPVRVRLPGEQDFALTALAAGAALAGTDVGAELLGAESGARANHRGLWASGCQPSQAPSASSTAVPTTTATSTAPRPAESTAPTSVPVDPTTTTPPDDVQRDVQKGQPCAPEGARGIDRNGRDVTCTATLVRGLRWRVK